MHRAYLFSGTIFFIRDGGAECSVAALSCWKYPSFRVHLQTKLLMGRKNFLPSSKNHSKGHGVKVMMSADLSECESNILFPVNSSARKIKALTFIYFNSFCAVSP